jgi:hypothetical protein
MGKEREVYKGLMGKPEGETSRKTETWKREWDQNGS